MSKRDRIMAVLRGEKPDRTPISFWKHFPDIDHDPDQLAEAHIIFQRDYDLDFVKMMPSGMYGTEDFGCRVGDPDPEAGAKRLLETPIQTISDWQKVEPLDPEKGARARELQCLRQVRKALGKDVPIIHTVFSPSTTVAKVMGRDAFIAALRQQPTAAHVALDIATQTEIAYALASLDHGADGIFFATQLAGDGLLSEEEYRTFGVAYDKRVLEAIAGKATFTLVHVHGMNPLFPLFQHYPAPAISWHDRRTSPSLSEAPQTWPGALAAGIDEWGVLRQGQRTAVVEDARQIVAHADPTRLVLAPGCVVPLDTPSDNLDAVRGAVE